LNFSRLSGLNVEKLEEYSNDLKSAKALLEKVNDYEFDVSIYFYGPLLMFNL
jgi:hypothetical protein